MAKNVKQRRERLFRQQDGRCCYCGIQMTLQQGKPTSCTLEHTISKLNPLRGKVQIMKAACWKCNNERGIKEQQEYQMNADFEKRVIDAYKNGPPVEDVTDMEAHLRKLLGFPQKAT